MKIKDLYRIKGFPIVTAAAAAASFLLSLVVWLKPELFDSLCLQTNPQYIWQYATGCFIHSIEPRWAMWIHLVMNFMGLIPLGILTEKTMGSRNALYLLLTELAATAILHQLLTRNAPAQACGISTVCYAFAAVGFFSILTVLKDKSVSRVRQPLFWYFLFELLGMLSLLNPMRGATSLLLHASGILTGGVFAFLFRNRIRTKIHAQAQETL